MKCLILLDAHYGQIYKNLNIRYPVFVMIITTSKLIKLINVIIFFILFINLLYYLS